MFTPKGYYTSQYYIGILPDGCKMRFPTQDEYVQYVEDLHTDAA